MVRHLHVKGALDAVAGRLQRLVSAIGVTAISGGDSQMLHRPGFAKRLSLEQSVVKPLIEGQVVRDWRASPELESVLPIRRRQLDQHRTVAGLAYGALAASDAY